MQTIVIGGAEHPWQQGGGDEKSSPPALPPDFPLTARSAGKGNAPGGIVDFESAPGRISPTQIDPARNVFDLIREQGGLPLISSPNVGDIAPAELDRILGGIIDGSETVYVRKSSPTKRNVNPLGEHIDIDLGERFGIDRIRFFPSSFFPSDFLKAYELSVSDGTPANLTESGSPLWTLIARDEDNTQSDTQVAIPLQFVRHLRLTSLTTVGFEVDEIELYGRGYVPASRFLSDVFDLGEKKAVWGRLRWAAQAIGDPRKSRLFVRTRTGAVPTTLIFTRTVTSRGLSEEPFRFALDQISYERAEVGGALMPVQLPSRRLSPTEYRALVLEVKDWLEGAGASYTLVGGEPQPGRAAYEAAAAEAQDTVSLGATQIPPDIYKGLSRAVRAWIAEGGAQYFRRANIDEEVPYDRKGNLLTAATYNALPAEERGPILDDNEHWSPWSAPYPAEGGQQGVQITSPAPRRYFQFEVRFESDLDAAQSLDSLSFEVSTPPLAQKLLAEIFPREVAPDQNVEFTYAVRPLIDPAGDLGFDSFEIRTPVPIQRLVEIRLLEADGQVRASQAFGEPVEGLNLPLQKGDFALVAVGEDRFRVRFPRVANSNSVLQLRFATAVLRYGTTFEGWAFDEQSAGLPQPAVAGNVASLGEGDADNLSGLTVLIDLSGQLLSGVSAFPNPFTPNGDGRNDRTEIRYDVLKVTEPASLSVQLYTLAGVYLRTLHAIGVPSGRYAVPWDGTDGRGQVVPPGLYLFRVKIRADARAEEKAGAIAVVY
ncbi:MAG: gliding motility-associated C-terminal domain-containing protein [Candidatus Handelsmanbacteria bacterium]|nr:gliding motility-associated C-terminal domain-containing protein [Candidatus Handelsmanbacteria bacterium]